MNFEAERNDGIEINDEIVDLTTRGLFVWII